MTDDGFKITMFCLSYMHPALRQVKQVKCITDSLMARHWELFTITGTLVIFILDWHWASFTIANSLVVIGELFLEVYCCYRLMEGCCRGWAPAGEQQNERINFWKASRKGWWSLLRIMLTAWMMRSGDINKWQMMMILDLFTHTVMTLL
jgi:hypothetical protein